MAKSDNSISDDQELAKALAHISDAASADPEAKASEKNIKVSDGQDKQDNPETKNNHAAEHDYDSSNNLMAIKNSAINELRPLVSNLNIPPEEKFDTYLMLIRSTNDHSLIKPAYEIAKQITNDDQRAQALLDIIKEVDYFTTPQ